MPYLVDETWQGLTFVIGGYHNDQLGQHDKFPSIFRTFQQRTLQHVRRHPKVVDSSLSNVEPSVSIPTPKSEPVRLYDTVFFCSYAANVFMLMSISLLFRYADFIKSMGGDEWHLGWVVGLGSVGAIVFRIYQGTAIDRFGPMVIWLLSLAGLITSNLLHVQIENVDGWPLYVARFLMNLCIAGVFGSWLSFVTLRVPTDKVAEVIGVVGSSGFAGMALGPVIG